MSDKKNRNAVDKEFHNIIREAEYALKDTRWVESQAKRLKAIERHIKRIHAYVSWAQMH